MRHTHGIQISPPPRPGPPPPPPPSPPSSPPQRAVEKLEESQASLKEAEVRASSAEQDNQRKADALQEQSLAMIAQEVSV